MMSTFNRFCNNVKNTFKKISDKTEELFDSAANSVKIKNLEMKIDEQYENLGRIVYRDLHTEEDLEERKLEIIAKIDALFDELEALKADKKAAEEETPAEECKCECDAEEPAPATEEKTEE